MPGDFAGKPECLTLDGECDSIKNMNLYGEAKLQNFEPSLSRHASDLSLMKIISGELINLQATKEGLPGT